MYIHVIHASAAIDLQTRFFYFLVFCSFFLFHYFWSNLPFDTPFSFFFSNTLLVISSKVRMDVPISLGFTILQLAKLRMLEFYYDRIDRQISLSIHFSILQLLLLLLT